MAAVEDALSFRISFHSFNQNHPYKNKPLLHRDPSCGSFVQQLPVRIWQGRSGHMAALSLCPPLHKKRMTVHLTLVSGRNEIVHMELWLSPGVRWDLATEQDLILLSCCSSLSFCLLIRNGRALASRIIEETHLLTYLRYLFIYLFIDWCI